MFVKVPVLLSVLLIAVTLARPQDAVPADQQQELGMALAQSILKYVGVDVLAGKDGNFSFKLGGANSSNQELPTEIANHIARLLKSFGHDLDADVSVNLMNANVKPISSP